MALRSLLFLLVLPAAIFVACGPDGSGEFPKSLKSHKALESGWSLPNVILIVMDTASGERCSLNGYSRKTTPHLEEIAREGLNFTNTWSPSGWTGPAHASMFTGLRPEHHGFHYGNRLFLRKQDITLAERLLEVGYRTACFTNNAYITAEYGLKQGFEHHVSLFEEEDLTYPTATLTHEMALDWVRKVSGAGDRFFLFINHMEPHFEYTPPQEFAEEFAGDRWNGEERAAADRLNEYDLFKHNIGQVEVPPGIRDLLSDLYDGEIACLDREIGGFVSDIEAQGLLENTLLVITSDHGENLGRHGLLDHKASLHRTLLYVPLVIRLPGGVRGGEVLNEVVRLEDLFPTILEVCGLSAPKGIDGESLLGDLGARKARATCGFPEKYLDSMEKRLGGRYGFERVMVNITSEFDGRFHRIEYSDGRRLVFDVLNDPLEIHPLAE